MIGWLLKRITKVTYVHLGSVDAMVKQPSVYRWAVISHGLADHDLPKACDMLYPDTSTYWLKQKTPWVSIR